MNKPDAQGAVVPDGAVGLKVDGEPLYKSGTKVRARPATEQEWTTYEREMRDAR